MNLRAFAMTAPLRRRLSFLWSVLIVALTGAGVVLLLTGRSTLIVPYWYNASALTFAPMSLLPGLLAIAVYLAGWRLLVGSRSRWMVGWSLLGGALIPVALLTPTGDPFYILLTRTVSSQSTGGFILGAQMTPAILHDWPALMPHWRLYAPHIGISAPGWPLLYHGLALGLAQLPGVSRGLANMVRPLQCQTWDWGLNQLTNAQWATAWFGIASPLWAALTVLPLYGLARTVAGEKAARSAVGLWPLVPALTAFAATLNTFYPFLAILVIYLVWSGVQDGALWRMLACTTGAGLLLGLLLLLNLSVAPLLLLVGLLVLFSFDAAAGRSLKAHLGWCVAVGLMLVFSILVVAAIYGLLAGHSLARVFLTAMQIHLGMDRPYFASMGLHVWDLAVFTGLPLAALALAGGFTRRSGAFTRLALALGVSLALVLISGLAQGEVGRVWIFLMPILLLLAAGGLQRLPLRWQRLLIGVQVLWLVALAAISRPIDTWLVAPPVYEQVARPPLTAPLLPADANFGDGLHLSGVQSQYHPESRTVTIALHWQALRPLETPYYFSAVLVAPNGKVLPGVHWQPFDKAYPTTCWPSALPRREVVDQVTLPLAPDAMPGDWWMSLTAFAMQNDQPLPPLPVHLPNGGTDQQVGLGPIAVRK
jgi:hypothetical protein